MPIVNQQSKELVFKIVYYGPGLGGKTTTLQHIHGTTRPEHRGKLVSLATPVDRTLYFDYLPLRLPAMRHIGVRLQLFTVPGQVHYNATRKLVLTGADGIVLVADSRKVRLEANLESLRNLEENLAADGRTLAEVPFVLMYNKRDLPELAEIEELEQVMNPLAAPSFAAVAASGEGVYEALEAITRAVIEDFERRMPEHRDLVPREFMPPEGGIAEALRGLPSASPAVSPVFDRMVEHGTTPGVGVTSSPPAPHPSRAVEAEIRPEGTVTSDGAFEVPVPSRPNLDAVRSSLGIDVAISGFGPSLTPETLQRTEDYAPSQLSHPRSNRESHLDESLLRGSRAPSRVEQRREAAPRTTARSEPSIFSLSALFRDADDGLVQSIEAALATNDCTQAVLLIADLIERSLAAAMVSTGQEGIGAAAMASLLGVDGVTYLEFGALLRRTKQRSDPPSLVEALNAWVLAAQIERGKSRLCP